MCEHIEKINRHKIHINYCVWNTDIHTFFKLADGRNFYSYAFENI